MNKFIKILIIILICLGVIYNIALVFSFDKKYPDETEINAVVKVVSMKTEKERSNSYTVKIVDSNIKNTKNTKILIYTSKDTNFKYGDIIQISGDFSKGDVARNYKGFSYRNYLKQSKIYGSVYSENSKFLAHESSVMEKIYELKTNLYDVLDNIYDENTNAFLKGILLGDSSNLDDEIKENFRNSSLSHVLAISGMHVSYVIIGVQAILDKLVNSRKLKNYIIIGVLAFFMVITGCAPSCMRACIMSGMLLISQNFYRKNNFYVTIIFTFFILIFINPFNIFAVGMWLSFGGTLGIVLFHKFVKRFLECKFSIKSEFAKKFLDVLLVSFAAQILIVPIMVYCFNTISLTFFVSNLLIYFLVGPILALGYISLILGLFVPKFGMFVAIFERFLVVIIFKIAEICSKLPFSKIYLPTPDFWMLILYYIVIAIIVYLFNMKKIKFLRFVLGNGAKEFVKKNLEKIASVGIIIIVLFNVVKLVPHDLRIYFVDVGQGDCSVIKSAMGKNIIIDGGNNQNYDYGENVVVPYLLDRKITKIDFLMVSHFDSDHCGGLIAVVENLKVHNIIIGVQDSEYENCTNFLELAKSKNINIIVVKSGDKVKIDKYTYFDILWPDTQNMISDNGINNNSIMAKLVYNDFSMLFTGDIEEIAEKEIIKKYKNTNVLNSNILKVAHHGSKSSSIQEMVEIINSKIAVIGVGSDNKYGHPSSDVVERLESYGSKVFRTDLNGEIMIRISPKLKLNIDTMIK